MVPPSRKRYPTPVARHPAGAPCDGRLWDSSQKQAKPVSQSGLEGRSQLGPRMEGVQGGGCVALVARVQLCVGAHRGRDQPMADQFLNGADVDVPRDQEAAEAPAEVVVAVLAA